MKEQIEYGFLATLSSKSLIQTQPKPNQDNKKNP